LTSAVITGMVLGSWLSGWILEYGRRRTIIIACLGIIVSASCSLALNIPTIVTAKFF
jgi:MFS family permease